MSDRKSEDWTATTLGDLGTLTTSSVDKNVASGEAPIRLVNYMDVYENNFIERSLDLMEVTATSAEIERFQVEVGDILFTPSSETPDDIGHSAVVADPLPNTLHSYHTVRLRPHTPDRLDVRFSGWFANGNAVLEHFRRRATGSTRYTLSIGDFQSAPVDLPPPSEQRSIAQVLDTLATLTRMTVQGVQKLRLIKTGLLSDLLHYGVDADGRLRQIPGHEKDFKESAWGEVPTSWDVVPLGQVAEVLNGSTPSRTRSDYWTNGNVPWLASTKVNDYRVRTPSALISRRALGDSSLRLLPPGAVIIGMIGQGKTRGMSARLDIPATINQNIAGVIPSKRIDGVFLHLFLHSHYQDLRSGGRGSNQDALNSSLVAAFPIVLPPIAEQRAIAAMVETIETRLDSEERKARKLTLLAVGVREALLTRHAASRVPVRTVK